MFKSVLDPEIRRGDDAVILNLSRTDVGAGPIAVAVSGGSDSMALLLLAVQAYGASRIIALTVDHGLRVESAAEATQVAAWCSVLNIPHHTLQWLGAKPETGIQAAARQARYDALTAWCVANGVATVMTAHTANDQAETVVMRKQRTDSLRSISGIWPNTTWNGVKVVRPLLHVTREELREHLNTQQQDWLEDPSNENLKFERIRVRKALAKSDIRALVDQAVTAQAHVLAEDQAVKHWLSVYGVMADTGVLTLQRQAIGDVDDELACAVLRWALWACGGGHSVAPQGVSNILEMIKAGAVTRMTLAGAVVAMRGKTLVVGREPARISAAPVLVPPSGVLQWDNRFEIAAPVGAVVSPVRSSKRWNALMPKGLPAFACGALPVVELTDATRFLPHFEVVPEISVNLCDRMRIS